MGDACRGVGAGSRSIYRRFQALYVRDPDRVLLHCTGPHGNHISQAWPDIRPALPDQPVHRQHDALLEPCRIQMSHHGLVVYELPRAGESTTTGLILTAPSPDTTDSSPPFETFFAALLLRQTNLGLQSSLPPPSTSSPADLTLASHIATIFDTHLRYHSPGSRDRWTALGRARFETAVQHFVAHDAPIQLCLPAFPCKSSSTDKIAGADPDRGEALALERLHGFVQRVEAVYSPGALVCVVSDGHVFSDCIGRDDADVDEYGRKLQAMNLAIERRRGRTDRVVFQSLVDLFELGGTAGASHDLAETLALPPVAHHVPTKLTEEAELSRRILMAACDLPVSELRDKIDGGNDATLALYRGFSRFMLDDLALHPAARELSRSQRKKLAARVSFEMIMRNQAYSNLVEMMLPNHIRLSIHAHDNAGPKFAVQLFDPSRVRTTSDLEDHSAILASSDHLHIPTPWHSCIVQLEGSDVFLITKARTVRESLARGRTEGGFVDGGEGVGGYFALRRVGPGMRKEDSEETTSQAPEAMSEKCLAQACSVTAYGTVVTSKDPRKIKGTFTSWILGILRGLFASAWGWCRKEIDT